MKKILWVSRHGMTEEQYNDLVRIYGDVNVTQYDRTVKNANEISVVPADVYAVVLPIELVAELMKIISAEVIQPVSERIPTDEKIFNKATGKYEQEYIFKHKCWLKINKCILETQKL